MAMALFFYVGNAMCYVFPVLLMTSIFKLNKANGPE